MKSDFRYPSSQPPKSDQSKMRFFYFKVFRSFDRILLYLGLTKSSCIDRKKYEDKEKVLILFH
jgi:hypothetical protein